MKDLLVLDWGDLDDYEAAEIAEEELWAAAKQVEAENGIGAAIEFLSEVG